MGDGIPSSSKTLEVTPKPVSHEEHPSDTSVGQQPVELKPSASAGQQPSASAGQQPSALAVQQSSASIDPQASTLTQQGSVLLVKIQDELRELRLK